MNYIDDELDPKDEKKKEEGMMKYILDSMKNKDLNKIMVLGNPTLRPPKFRDLFLGNHE